MFYKPRSLILFQHELKPVEQFVCPVEEVGGAVFVISVELLNGQPPVVGEVRKPK
jgi:hypothetical protein